MTVVVCGFWHLGLASFGGSRIMAREAEMIEHSKISRLSDCITSIFMKGCGLGRRFLF